MEYKERSLTRDGATLFATADANKKALVIDKMVISDHVVTAGTDLSTLTLADFTNAKQFDATNASQNTNSFTVTSVLTNEGLTEELNVALIGLLAHVEGADDDARIIAVAVGNDPFSLPVDQGTVFKLVPSITVGFSYAETVTVTVADDVYVTQANLQAVLKAQGFATEKELEGYLKELPANVAYTDAANTFTQQQTLAGGAVDGTGNAIATTKDVSDGDATTLTSAKAYADTKVSGKADDSKVAHLSGANNFDTTPTVNNNPLLLASSLPSTLADTTKDANFTGKLQKSGIDVATTTDVTTAISTATANTVGIDPNTSQITNTTVKANAGQILISGQPAISLVQSADDATALTDSSKDAILHFTIEG